VSFGPEIAFLWANMQIVDLIPFGPSSAPGQNSGGEADGAGFARHLNDFYTRGLATDRAAEPLARPEAPHDRKDQQIAARENLPTDVDPTRDDEPVIQPTDDNTFDGDGDGGDPVNAEAGDTDPDAEAGDTDPDAEAGDTDPDAESGDTEDPDAEAGDTDPDAEAGDTDPNAEAGDTNPDAEAGGTDPDADTETTWTDSAKSDDGEGNPEESTAQSETEDVSVDDGDADAPPHQTPQGDNSTPTKTAGKPTVSSPALAASNGLSVAQAKAEDHVPDHTPVAGAKIVADAGITNPGDSTQSAATTLNAGSAQGIPGSQDQGTDPDALMAAVALGNLGKDFSKSPAELAAMTKKAAAVNPGAERPDADPKAIAKPGQNSQGQMAKAAVANQNPGKGGAGNGNSNPGGNGQQTGGNLAGNPTMQAGPSTNGNVNPGQVAMDPAFKAALLNTTSHGPVQAATAGQMIEQIAGAADPAATSTPNNGKTIAQVTKIASPRPPVLPQLNGAANQVAMQLAQAANDGTTKFTMRLHPAELGRVDVRLEIAAGGQVTAAITADRQETLDLLRHDSRVLEKALEQAGLHADSNDLQFGLRDQGDDHARGGPNDHGPSADPAADDMDVVAGTWVGGPSVVASGALDIHV